MIDNEMWLIMTVNVNGVSLVNDYDAAITVVITVDQGMAVLLPE